MMHMIINVLSLRASLDFMHSHVLLPPNSCLQEETVCWKGTKSSNCNSGKRVLDQGYPSILPSLALTDSS